MNEGWLKALKEARIPKPYRLRVRERLVVLEYALTHGMKPAARRFGVDRKTVRRWHNRWRAGGVQGSVPRYPRIRVRPVSESLRELVRIARQEFGYGSTRTQLWLWRVHRLRVAQSTIQRVARELEPPRCARCANDVRGS